MNVEGTYRFPAPPERVWALLQDPAALAVAIPGCQKLESLGDGRYAATLQLGVAAFKGVYNGEVRVSDLVPPRSYDLHIEGSGRPGFVKGIGHITLTPEEPGGTLVSVDGDAQVGGLLSLAGRLVDPTARLLLNQFFAAMQRQLEAQAR
jgi:carbon monoxide dehydrogenase subunit G